MQRLLVAGLLYLTGIAILLALKPSFMFAEDGAWKEFGIGRNPRTHTWMPFWLFAVLWALVSYIATLLIFSIVSTNDVVDIEKKRTPTFEKPKSRGKAIDLPDGYYMLNGEATEAAGGIPKYVYLGKGLPEE